MTAAVITRPGAETVAAARVTFRRAMAAQWPDGDRDGLVTAVRALGTALKRWDDLRCGIIPPWLTGFEPGAEGLEIALRQAADYAWEASEEVTELIGENFEAAGAAGTRGES